MPVISTAFWKKHNLCACLGKILRLAGGSGKDWRVNMSGWSVCFFPVNPSIFAGYNHVSFDDYQKCKILYF
jgi:hypothetical protein